MRPRPTSTTRSRQRGVTLFESLVAFFVLAAGTAAVAQLQSHVRLAIDVARERSEAVRVAEETIEDLRSFAAIDGVPGRRSYAAIADAELALDPASSAAHTAMRIARRVDDATFPGAKAVNIVVEWSDRSGAPRRIAVDTFVAGVDPAYSGSLALDGGAVRTAPRGFRERAPGLPLTARTLGGGRSGWKPVESGTTAWVFDDRTGAIVGRCDAIPVTTPTRDLGADALRACAAGRWLFVSGTVRSATGAPAPVATLAPGATTVTIELRDGSYAAPPSCFARALKTVRIVDEDGLHLADVALDATAPSAGLASWQETGDRFVAWHCLVTPRSDGRWSGRIALVADGWTIGTASGDGRVCRIADLRDGDAIDANIAPAAVERDIGAALLGRNFVVVRGSDPCPRTPPSEQHQP